MFNPYVNTYLEDDVIVKPQHMDNNIDNHITETIVKKHSNKCFKNYGFITKIFEVDSNTIRGGLIRPEDGTASALVKVKFKCRLCNPMKDTLIVAKITGINDTMIIASNGPIRIMIGRDNINKNKIRYINKRNAFYPIDEKTEKVIDQVITNGTHVIIRVSEKKIVDKSSRIIVLGILESVATQKDISNSIIETYDENSESVPINEFLMSEQNKNTEDSYAADAVKTINK